VRRFDFDAIALRKTAKSPHHPNDMPLDTNLLYGTSIASGILHLAMPFGLSLLVAPLGGNPWILLGLTMILSFVLHGIMFLGLQGSACDGVKEYKTIAGGAFIGSVVVGVMATIPILFESMRLVPSQLGGKHLPLITPDQMENLTAVADTALKARGDLTTDRESAARKMGIGKNDYENQTFRETWMGMSYWAAFGGLYGVGLGSLIAAGCPATN